MHNPKGAWRMCVGACILQLFIVGFSINSFSVYLPYLLRKCDLSNTQSANILLVRNCVAFASLFFVGKVYEKLELRMGITLAFCCSAAGMLLYSTADSFYQLALGAFVSGFGYGLGGMYPVSLLLHRWFRLHEPIALGICTACTGLAVIVGSPVITAISEAFGVQRTLFYHSMLLIIGALCCFAMIRNYPADVQQRKAVQKKHKSKFRFRWMYVAALCVGINGSTSFQFLAMHFTNRGLDPYQVATIISVVGTALMISKFLFGGAIDHFGTRRTNRVFMLVSVVGLALCCVSGKSYVWSMVAMILYGLGLAYATIGLTVYAEDLSAAEDFENRVREYQICYLLGSLISSPIPGIIADTTGSYIPFYAAASVLGLIALIIIENNYKKIPK